MILNQLPQSILFCCDHNSVRSPMAEAIAKKLFGTEVYLQSVGLKSDLDIDGFAIARWNTGLFWTPLALERGANPDWFPTGRHAIKFTISCRHGGATRKLRVNCLALDGA